LERMASIDWSRWCWDRLGGWLQTRDLESRTDANPHIVSKIRQRDWIGLDWIGLDWDRCLDL